MNLTHLSDKSLHENLKTLVSKERKILTEILHHLSEVERRKLYADFKCSSLFDYCIKILKYSEGVLSQHLKEEAPKTKEEVLSLVSKIESKTTHDSKMILNEEKQTPKTKTYKIEVDEETYKLLQELRNLKGHKGKDHELLKESLRDTKKEVLKKKFHQTEKPRPKQKEQNPEKRTPSAELKRKIYKRDGGQCTQCGHTHDLEFDHIRPVAMGGKTREENLRLLCRNCNGRAWVKKQESSTSIWR